MQKSVTVFMAMLLLVSSTGFSITEHQCLVRGKSMQLLPAKSKGCKGCRLPAPRQGDSRQQVVIKKSHCCKDESRYEKLEVVSSSSQWLVKFIKTIAGATPFCSEAFVFSPAGRNILREIPPFSSSFSSLLSGRSMRCFIQSFLI